MHRRRLRKFAKFLREEVPRKRFNMDTWGDPGFEKDACGTSACALGWATVCFPRSGFEVKLVSHLHPEFGVKISLNHSEGTGAGQNFFGLTRRQALDLFCGNDRTPKQKAKEIENLLAS